MTSTICSNLDISKQDVLPLLTQVGQKAYNLAIRYFQK